MPFAQAGWMPWIGGGIAFLCVLGFTPLVIRWAHRQDWLARPTHDRWHERPTALMGGLAIYAAAVLGMAVAFSLASSLWPVWVGATLLFATGLIDDLKHIRPVVKLLAQIVATVLLIYAGYLFGPAWPVWISVPVTFFWVIGITNAVNLLDNMDGLAAGIAAIAALVLAVFSVLAGDEGGATVSMVVAGTAAGFLVFNFKPARIFMGDGGSLFLGYVIAALAIIVQTQAQPTSQFAVYLVSATVLAVPIFDTTLVCITRTASGRSVAQGGRDHSSHRLVFSGLTERGAVLTLYGVSALCGGIALLFRFAETTLFYALLMFVIVGLVVFGVYLARADVYPTVEDAPTVRSRFFAAVHALLGRDWKPVVGMGADLMLVVASFIVAYHLRFADGITPGREAYLLRALPVVVAVKLPVFYGMKLYQPLWRHAGTTELVRILQAAVMASGGTFIALGVAYGFGSIARGVIVIDWMIVVLAVTGVRFGFRGLRQYISAQRKTGRRALLYGADDAGLIALRTLRHNAELGLTPVGFVDDDPSKHHKSIQGLPVLGGFEDLGVLCREHRADEVLVTMTDAPEDRLGEISALCDQIGVRSRMFRVSFDALPQDGTLTSTVGGDGIASRDVQHP